MEGTRVPVSSIVVQWLFHGSVDPILEAFPHMDAASVEAALRFYEKHREEIDKLIGEHERAANATD